MPPSLIFRGGFSTSLKLIVSANSKSPSSIFFNSSVQSGRSYLKNSIMDYSLGNFFKPSAIAIKSLGLA